MSVVEVIKHYQRSIEKCPENQERMLHCISKLYRLPVTVQHLQDTGVGRTVNALRKYEGDTGEAAKALVAKWKAMVAAEDSSDDEDRHEDTPKYEKEEKEVKKHKDRSSHREQPNSKSHHEEKSRKSSSHDHQSKKRKYEEENGKVMEKRRKKQEVESDSSEEQEDISQVVEQDDDSDGDSEVRSPSQTSQNMDSSDNESYPPSRVQEREKHISHRKHKDRSIPHKDKTHWKEGSSRKEQQSQKEERSHKHERSWKEEHSRKEHKQKSEQSQKEEYVRREEHSRKGEHSRKDNHGQKEDSNKSEKVKMKTETKVKSKTGTQSNIPESPAKSKEKIKVKKEKLEDEDGSIDCSTGASFAEALGMVDPIAKKKLPSSPGTSSNSSTPRSSAKSRAESVTPKKKERSVPSSPPELSLLSPSVGLLSPNVKLEPLNDVEVDLLPPITPNYKPLPHYNRLDSPPHRKTKHLTEEEALSQVMSTKNQRTKVYSGVKGKGHLTVPSLYDICVRVLQENIEALEYTGGVPYDLLKPVLQHVTAEQLFALEHHNPYLVDDTDELWQFHCQREFRTKQRQDMETAREMYLRCMDEREAKLKALTTNIQQSIANSTPVRQTKLAYVDSVAKPPRNVARQQAKYGTARVNTKPNPATKTARASGAAASSASVHVPAPTRPVHTAPKAKPRMAPLMQKTMKLVKSFKR